MLTARVDPTTGLEATLDAAPSTAPEPSPVAKHPWWDPELSWKRTLNNLRLLIQPFYALCLLLPWMAVFPVPGLIDKLRYLVRCINGST
jgi:hypothetical protein